MFTNNLICLVQILLYILLSCQKTFRNHMVLSKAQSWTLGQLDINSRPCLYKHTALSHLHFRSLNKLKKISNREFGWCAWIYYVLFIFFGSFATIKAKNASSDWKKSFLVMHYLLHISVCRK